MKTLLKIFPFIASTRFWAIVIVGLAMLLNSKGFIPEELYYFIWTVCSGHVGIRSLDRAFEQFAKIGKK